MSWQTASDAGPDLRDVIAAELALLRRDVRTSRGTTLSLLHPQAKEFGESGRVWDAPRLADALADEAENAEVEVRDVCGVQLASHVVLVTYEARRGGRSSLRSSVWRRQLGTWQLLFHQGTPRPDD